MTLMRRRFLVDVETTLLAKRVSELIRQRVNSNEIAVNDVKLFLQPIDDLLTIDVDVED